MENLFVFMVAFTFIFITFLINYVVKRQRNGLAHSKEVELLINRFKISRNNLNYNALGLIFVLVNSLIIAVTGTICTMVKLHYIWQLVIGFVLLMFLIYAFYGVIGMYLKRKEVKNGKHHKN